MLFVLQVSPGAGFVVDSAGRRVSVQAKSGELGGEEGAGVVALASNFQDYRTAGLIVGAQLDASKLSGGPSLPGAELLIRG